MIELTRPQFEFVTAEERFPAMVAGFGAGKSEAAMWRTLRLKRRYPGQDVAYYLPTYDLVSRMAFPRLEEKLEGMGASFKINKNDSLIQIWNCGSIILRTMENPARIVAYEVADSICDELDTLPIDKAREVWNKVIARNRQKKPDGAPNSVGVATTPEGFRFVYERWAKNPADGYRLIRATTMSNAHNLPDGYIDSLRNSYPANLLAAYLDGQFVNLTSGSIYAEFDRALNRSTETIQVSEPLYIGMDFNVMNMTAIVSVIREDRPITVAEFVGVRDTPTMARLLSERYVQRDQPHPLTIYPDASGQNTSSKNASESDLSILRTAKFSIRVEGSNPRVRDRVLSVNAQILNDAGERRWKLNTDRCPKLTDALEQQAYDASGEPDKSAGFDHPVDAVGYFIVNRFPVVRRRVVASSMTL